MTWVEFTSGFLLGCGFYHVLTSLPIMWRRCCREHFETHLRCDCDDCRRARNSA